VSDSQITPPEIPQRPGPGGTSGGTGEFVAGFLLMVAGGYLFLDSVHVTSHWGGLFGLGRGSFGLSLLPLLVGIGFLFFNGKSAGGWLLVAAGAIIIFVGVLSRLDIYFTRKSLFETLLMLGMLAGGVGLIVRSLRAH
jgi:uncharacterized protein